MKCDKCGFIFNGEKDVCPYCGSKINGGQDNFLHSTTAIIADTRIKNFSIISLVLINLFVISIVVDWCLGFKYKVTLISFFLFIGLFTLLTILYRRKTPLSIFMSIDIYLIFLIFLFSLFGNFGSLNLTGLFSGVVLPLYVIFSSLLMVIFVLIAKNKGYSPIAFVFYLIFKLLVGLTLFILGTIYFTTNGSALTFFDVSNFISSVKSTDLVRTICIGSFGVTALVFANAVIFILVKVANNIKKYYGNRQ